MKLKYLTLLGSEAFLGPGAKRNANRGYVTKTVIFIVVVLLVALLKLFLFIFS